MCQFFSALVLRNGDLIYDTATDSHADLIDAYGLDKAENARCSHFAKIEFTPKSMEVADKLDTYTLRVDEMTEPIWFEDVRDRVLQQCRSIVGRMIIIGEHKCILGGKHILASGAFVGRSIDANFLAMLGTSQVGEMRETSQVGTMLGTSQVGEMWGTSRVGTMRETSRVGTMRETSRVGTMRETSQVGEMWGTSRVGTMRETSQVSTMWGTSRVGTMLGTSQVGTDNRDEK